jgi:hypothetical protein
VSVCAPSVNILRTLNARGVSPADRTKEAGNYLMNPLPQLPLHATVIRDKGTDHHTPLTVHRACPIDLLLATRHTPPTTTVCTERPKGPQPRTTKYKRTGAESPQEMQHSHCE